MNIEWEEPPAEVLERHLGGGHKAKYLDVAVALRDHPGRWAVLPSLTGGRTEKGAAATAQNVRRGQVKGFTRGQYDAVAHGTKVYVRYRDEASREEGPEDGEADAPPTPRPPARAADSATVRAWAQKQGLTVTSRGRLPDELYERYEAAQQRPGLRAVERRHAP